MELRTAAGLPVGAKAVTGLRAEAAGLARNARRSWDNTLQSARRDKSVASVIDFLAVLAPVWWVVRALVATWVVWQIGSAVFGEAVEVSGFFLIVFAMATIGSVQLGRGRWTFPGQETVTTLGNGLAILLLIPVWVGIAPGTSVEYVDSQEYDEDMCAQAQPARLVTGSLALNVFPLTVVPFPDADGEELVLDEGETPELESALLKAPFVMVPGVDAIDEAEAIVP